MDSSFSDSKNLPLSVYFPYGGPLDRSTECPSVPLAVIKERKTVEISIVDDSDVDSDADTVSIAEAIDILFDCAEGNHDGPGKLTIYRKNVQELARALREYLMENLRNDAFKLFSKF